MCPTLEYISSWASIFGFILTLITLIVANNVKNKVLQLREAEQLHINRDGILHELEGYIRSITNDCLYESDYGRTLQPNILIHLKDIETKYTHLPRKTKKQIKATRSHLECLSINWRIVAEDLTALKNSIEKEI